MSTVCLVLVIPGSMLDEMTSERCQMPRRARAMTRSELLALPTSTDLVTAGRAIGVGRSKAYEMAQAGTWPTRLLRLGNAYRVPTAELLALLGVQHPQADERHAGEQARGTLAVESAPRNAITPGAA